MNYFGNVKVIVGIANLNFIYYLWPKEPLSAKQIKNIIMSKTIDRWERGK